MPDVPPHRCCENGCKIRNFSEDPKPKAACVPNTSAHTLSFGRHSPGVLAAGSECPYEMGRLAPVGMRVHFVAFLHIFKAS